MRLNCGNIIIDELFNPVYYYNYNYIYCKDKL